MKLDIPVPFEKLIWFKTKLGLEMKDLAKLNQYRSLFIDKTKEFSEYFHKYFYETAETRIILEHEKRPSHLRKAWTQWFKALFEEDLNKRFLAYVWRSGLRHVEVNLDKRFINLGYSVLRQFCQKIVRREIPAADQEIILEVVDKMVDFCLLIETQAYLAATSQCDMEVVKGISHQVRNPITIIGGNIIRLKKAVEPHSSAYRIYEAILGESERLESMVSDVGIYSEMLQRETEFSDISMGSLISNAIQKLKAEQWVKNVNIDIGLSSEFPNVQGDQQDLEKMFYYLLQNSLEAADPENPYIRITSKVKNSISPFIEIEIFNSGLSPTPEDMNNLFVPFYSSKPYGTGFGLPIAQLAARKSLGELYLEPIPNQGTRCVIKLPIPAKKFSKG
jgi:signal transduction histidine kinase